VNSNTLAFNVWLVARHLYGHHIKQLCIHIKQTEWVTGGSTTVFYPKPKMLHLNNGLFHITHEEN